MKIEIGKKYKTRNGQDVRIYAVDGVGDKKVHGAIFDGEGFYSNDWYENGVFKDFGKHGDFDLVKAKEDWEVLVEHFKTSDKPVFVLINGDMHPCFGIEKDSVDIVKFYVMLDLWDEGLAWKISSREEIKLATLEDCKKYILEK